MLILPIAEGESRPAKRRRQGVSPATFEYFAKKQQAKSKPDPLRNLTHSDKANVQIEPRQSRVSVVARGLTCWAPCMCRPGDNCPPPV